MINKTSEQYMGGDSNYVVDASNPIGDGKCVEASKDLSTGKIVIKSE